MRLARLFIASVVAVSAPAQAAEWWWIGFSGQAPTRVITYVDKASIRAMAGGALEVWTLAIAGTPSPNGQQLQAAKNAVHCGKGTFAMLGRVAYGADGSKLPLSEVPPSRLALVGAGSIGESVIKLACGKPSGIELKVSDPFQHAATYLYAGSKASSPYTPETAQPRAAHMARASSSAPLETF